MQRHGPARRRGLFCASRGHAVACASTPTLCVSSHQIIASENTVAVRCSPNTFPAGFGASRSSSVFLFVATQRTSTWACGLSVLRRPANQSGAAATSSQHRKNSSLVRCSAPASQAAFLAGAGSASPNAVALKAAQLFRLGLRSSPFFLQPWGFQFRQQMPKSGAVQLRCAPRPARQQSLAAGHPQCTHNRSLKRNTKSGPLFNAAPFLLPRGPLSVSA